MNHAIGNRWTRGGRLAAVPAILLAGGLSLAPLRAQEAEPTSDPLGDLKKDVEALKKGQADIQRQLQEIRRLLLARPQAQARQPSGPNVEGVVFSLGDRPTKGENTAPLTLVEFTDYQ